jgi:hypothetical protein
MSALIDTLLLLALPASGKSEVRRYLGHLDRERRKRDLRVGNTVQIDDFPYVHLMRVISLALKAVGQPPIFFATDDGSMIESRDWGTLIELVNEDYAALLAGQRISAAVAGEWLWNRIETAGRRVGIPPRLAGLPEVARTAGIRALEKDARELIDGHNARIDAPASDRTIVIEFARGGREGSPMPLPVPFGYRYSLSQLSPAILERASILYVWVTPEESRRKNRERANPSDPGSILHHGVPEHVMLQDYGCDDMDWLQSQSDRPGRIRLEAHGKVWHVPFARFDNRKDTTSFLRADPAAWPVSDVSRLHSALSDALQFKPSH